MLDDVSELGSLVQQLGVFFIEVGFAYHNANGELVFEDGALS